MRPRSNIPKHVHGYQIIKLDDYRRKETENFEEENQEKTNLKKNLEIGERNFLPV